MGVIAWIVVGLVAGLVARAITRSPQPRGCILTTAVGIIGALIGGALMNAAGKGGNFDFSLRSILVAILGSVVFLLVLRAIERR
ncbi:MAG: hypothetical protein QOD72_2204 [Acidimicrobiaceae bacterium]|jgi:uncharacterized membrane protein YeaQ/YmgE (transglycosylase-associated protein family)|nr:hypothetical protein [Acidimicrobiaceae bacterium]